MKQVVAFIFRPVSKKNLCWLSILLLCYVTLVVLGLLKNDSIEHYLLKVSPSPSEKLLDIRHATRRAEEIIANDDDIRNLMERIDHGNGANESYIHGEIDDENDLSSRKENFMHEKPKKNSQTIQDVGKNNAYNSLSDESLANGSKKSSKGRISAHALRDLKSDDKNVTTERHRSEIITKFENYLHDLSASYFFKPVSSVRPLQTTGVVIFTNYRSGSTFLGELFNQHPDAFYTFEPLIVFGGICAENRKQKLEHLKKYLKCDFQPMTSVYKNSEFPWPIKSIDQQCLYNNFCFRIKTKELCHRNMCFNPTNLCRKCGPVPLPRVMDLCRSKKISVVKVIRICDILDLKDIATISDLDLKIIHLVRDPRGIESSRMKLHQNFSMASDVQGLCKRLLSNANQTDKLSEGNTWLKKRYLRVRYEDLSMEPINIAKKIYKFVGLETNSIVEKWIEKNTQSSVGGGKRVNPYSTKRNSSLTMQAWRQHLTFEQVNTIQNICSKTLEYFGYKPLSNQKELVNFDINVLE